MIEYKVEKSEGDDLGYCRIQVIDNGGRVSRRVISRIWAESNEEHPGRFKVRVMNHGAEGAGTLAKTLSASQADEYMRDYMGFNLSSN